MLKLFYATGTCALASHIALQEAGADYETVRLDFRSNDQRKPEYLAINPKGRVPALVTDRGILTETPAILVFVAQTFPQARLAPLGKLCTGGCAERLAESGHDNRVQRMEVE
jgi:glutathione S-transferase